MGQPENGFQAAYVCFGEVLMREYAFRFAYDSLRVSRILQSSPWSMFLGGAFFVSLFGSGLLAVDFQAALWCWGSLKPCKQNTKPLPFSGCLNLPPAPSGQPCCKQRQPEKANYRTIPP